MDKLIHYQTVIKASLTRCADILRKSYPPIPYDLAIAFDDEHQQYVLRKVGWTETRRIHRTILHITLKEGKIWVEEDWTEEGIATDLLEQGVPREDIVKEQGSPFQPPALRPYGEFAVA